MNYNAPAMVKIGVLVVVLGGFVFGQTQPPSQPGQSQTAQSVQAQVPLFTIKPIGKDIYAAISGRAGGNTGFIIGDNSVLVVDTFISQTPARDLLSEIRKVTNLPVKYVVNTHYHLDHVAGNAITEAVLPLHNPKKGKQP